MRRKHRNLADRKRKANAFTLLEIVIAIALSGILLTSAAAIVVNTVRLWEKSDDVASLDRHLSGLNRFLCAITAEQDTLQIAQTESGKTVVGCKWTSPPNLDVTFPSFTISEDYPIFRLNEKPLPEISAWLYWDSDGLWLISQTPRQKNENEHLASFTLLSPFFESAKILAWNDEFASWETVDNADAANFQNRSVRLLLRFKRENRVRELSLTLSKTLAGGRIY